MDRLVANENKNKSDFRDELIDCQNEGRRADYFDDCFSPAVCPYEGVRAAEWKAGWNESWDKDLGD
jgi:hypothetical protein